ncbi:F-box/WD repeat-containing protein 10 F-box and WD-40 domain-containing protein 10 [Triplophysa tibetana]|uniref:F-box/WD repeat-containing protein 10 F-box and WD-40 domain-containing protein 10 n=1 Tax=Triplophysa tibetana TaxID=1572043 RepID=A0A5A9PT87_9TELE|nr:F-box/WD repeat-containing protein 10 F-box and WD-40 domain-containing protein 10 [Triplophysa tibetana]
MAEITRVCRESCDLMMEWSCKGEGEFNICGRCQPCVLNDRVNQFTQWMQNTGRASQKRFLTGILMRSQNLPILENLRSVLKVTSGKDFNPRFRHQTNKTKETSSWSVKLHGMDMLETWEWFRKSPEWTKSKYLLGVLSSCDTHLLHILENLVHSLIDWEKHKFLQFNNADVCHSAKNWDERNGNGDSGSDGSDDSTLTVIPGSSKSSSGVSHYRDLIRRLPLNVAERILGLLDKASLNSCRRVSKHWRYLSEEVLTEKEWKKRVWKQAMILRADSKSRVNPVYAKICDVEVPIDEEEQQFQHDESFPKYKVEQDFDSVYKGIKTKTIQLEERNVYCGAYNILVLLKREDPSRVMHYAGGQLVAVGSRDRSVRILDVASLKEVPLVIRGHAGSVRAVLVCEEKDLVISASYDLSIRCWNLKTGVCTRIFHGHFGTINCLDLCGERLVSGAKDCRVKVWNLLTGKCIDRLMFKHPKPITCVKIDETVVISSCAGGLVRIWNMESASLIKQISGHQGAVLCLCLDRWHILSGGSDGTVKAWSTNSGFNKCLRTFQHPKEVVTMSFLFLRVITGCMDENIRIFNFLNGDCLRVIKMNVQQSPILSLHTHHNTVVVNTRGTVLMLQFAEVQWDYSAVNHFFRQSYTYSGGLWSKEKSSYAQPELTRAMTWSHLQAHRHRRAFIDLQPELLTEPRSCPSTGSLVNGCSKDLDKKVNHTLAVWSAITSLDKETNSVLLSQSEKAVRDRIRKRGPHHPMTLDMILLRATSSKYGQSNNLASSNMGLNARVRDAWGPDSSRETQSSKTHTSGPSLPSTEATLKKSAKLGAPSTTHKHVHLNPQRSRQSSSSTRSPAQLEAKSTKGTPPKHSRRPLKVASGGMNKITPLNTLSQEDGKSPEHFFVRKTATAPAPRRCQHISQPPRSIWRAQSLPAENRHTVGGIYSGADQTTADSQT